jgi:hypothetical protein
MVDGTANHNFSKIFNRLSIGSKVELDKYQKIDTKYLFSEPNTGIICDVSDTYFLCGFDFNVSYYWIHRIPQYSCDCELPGFSTNLRWQCFWHDEHGRSYTRISRGLFGWPHSRIDAELERCVLNGRLYKFNWLDHIQCLWVSRTDRLVQFLMKFFGECPSNTDISNRTKIESSIKKSLFSSTFRYQGVSINY